MAMATFEDMETATCCLLQIIQDTPELNKDTKIAISGTMAMRQHLPNYMQDGAAQSIDLIINSTTSASLLRKKLLQHPMSPLVELNQMLYFQPSTAKTASPSARTAGTEVRITPEMLLPFLPSAARLAHEITPAPGHLPYVSLVDLIVFKMDSCGLRDSTQGKQQEARDAAALLEAATTHCALELNEDQIRVVEECLPDILRHSTADKGWWQARLIGKCDLDARKPVKEVLASLIENMSLDDSSKKSPPSMGRTPSSSSKTSLSSMASSSSGNFVTSSSPVTANGPGLPPSNDLSCSIPRRSRKFSTSQQSPTKGMHARKQSIDQKPKRHSQILGSLPSGPHITPSPTDDGFPGSPGLTLTARFESTPGEEKLVSGSYF
ncbi:unnamed protein product [Discula destructiva]